MPHIETDRLIIRNARVSDAEILHKYRESEFVRKYNAMIARSIESMRELLECDSRDDKAMYIELKATGEPIGAIWFAEDDMRYRVNALTTECWLGEPHARKGYMTEAYRALLPRVFASTGAELISARVFAVNAPSRALFEKLGFRLEGVLRRAVEGYGGIIYDDALYSLLRGDCCAAAIEFRDMSADETRAAYYEDAIYQFPAAELKPCDEIEILMRDGVMLSYGAYVGADLAVYMISGASPRTNALFLQYFAVKRSLHGKGIGTRALHALYERHSRCDFVLCDIEDPEATDDPAEIATRKRRAAFYARSGFYDVGVRARVCGMDYIVMTRPLRVTPAAEDVEFAADAIYNDMILSDASPAGYKVWRDA